MSESATLISSASLTLDAFMAFVRGLGGGISSEEHLDGGISRADGAIWFYGARKELGRGAVLVSRRVAEKLGGVARSRVNFELSSQAGSAQLMLDVGAEFTRTWPGVMNCALHRVLTTSTLGDLATDCERDDDEEKLILGEGLRLCFTKDVSAALVPLLGRMSGATLRSSPEEGVETISEALASANVSLEPEDIRGWIEADHAKVWVSQLFEIDDEDDDTQSCLSSILQEKLGQDARYMLWLATGYGASKANERLCFLVTKRILQEIGGVAVGLIDSALDAEAIRRLASARRGFIE